MSIPLTLINDHNWWKWMVGKENGHRQLRRSASTLSQPQYRSTAATFSTTSQKKEMEKRKPLGPATHQKRQRVKSVEVDDDALSVQGESAVRPLKNVGESRAVKQILPPQPAVRSVTRSKSSATLSKASVASSRASMQSKRSSRRVVMGAPKLDFERPRTSTSQAMSVNSRQTASVASRGSKRPRPEQTAAQPQQDPTVAVAEESLPDIEEIAGEAASSDTPTELSQDDDLSMQSQSERSGKTSELQEKYIKLLERMLRQERKFRKYLEQQSDLRSSCTSLSKRSSKRASN